MNKRFYVEQRAGQDYPWQFVDAAAGLRAGPVSIHKTKCEANKARDAYKLMLKRDAAETKRRIARLRAERGDEGTDKSTKVNRGKAPC